MNTKEAFREGIKKFASEELGLDEDHTNRYVDLVEKEADQLAALVALSSDGEMDKSAADSVDDPLEKYLCKRAGEMLDEAEEMDKNAGSGLLSRLASSVPGSAKLSNFATNQILKTPGWSGLSKTPPGLLSKAKLKVLSPLAHQDVAGTAIAATLGGTLYSMSGGDPEEASEEELATIGEQAMEMLKERGPGAAFGGGLGYGAGRLAGLEGTGQALSSLAGGAAGAATPEILEALTGSEEA